jgi:cytochrome c oxidase assembly protein subunit 15
VAGTVALWVRCTEGTGRAVPLARRELRLLAYGMIAVVTAQFAVGTVVTGTGPLAGAVGVPRYHLSLEGITQLHADVGWLLGGVVFALVLGLRLTGAPARATRTAYLLLGLIALQGLIGYVQYFSHLPAGLVWLHVTNSALIWIVAVLLPFRLRDRGSVTAPGRTPPSAPDGTAVQPAPDEVSTPTV